MVDIACAVDTHDVLGETPVWSTEEQALYWVDVRRPAVHRWDTLRRETKTWPMPELAGSLSLCATGGVLVALRSRIARLDLATGNLVTVAVPGTDSKDMRLNDGKCDRRGRFWVGSMNDVTRQAEGTLYRLDASSTCAGVLNGICVPNSLCWSPDDRTMYFTGPDLRTLFAFPFDPEAGSIGQPRVLAEIAAPAFPDGATVDADGFIWLAIYGGWRLMRYTPDGRIDRTIELPVQCPTSCAFGGPGLEVLYVTTATQRIAPDELARQKLAGAVLALDVGAKGLREPKFAG